MNANTKTHIATALTAFAAVLVALPGIFTSPPFTADQIAVIGNILVLLTLTATVVKQVLSAEVNSNGMKVTLAIGIVTILTGVSHSIGAFHLADATQYWITWGISLVVLILNVISKIVFPSGFQQDKVQELKTIDKAKTQ